MSRSTTEPRLKRCATCRKWKDRERDFYKSSRISKGKKYVYPAGSCKKCVKLRVQRYRARLRAVGELKDAERRWESHRDSEHRRKRAREAYRMARGKSLHHVWSKYLHELELGINYREFDADELVAFMDRFLVEDHYQGDRKNFHKSTGEYFILRINGVRLTVAEQHQLSRWRRGTTKRVSIKDVDHWATRFDLPMWELEEVAKIVA